jgi:hypothetical protein
VTTDPTRTGLAGIAGDVTLSEQNQWIDINDHTTIDSGRNVVFRVRHGGLCVRNASAIEANDGDGTIYTRKVDEGAHRGGDVRISGTVVNKPFCPSCLVIP